MPHTTEERDWETRFNERFGFGIWRKKDGTEVYTSDVVEWMREELATNTADTVERVIETIALSDEPCVPNIIEKLLTSLTPTDKSDKQEKCEHEVVAKYCFRCKRPDLAGEPKVVTR